MGLDEAMAADGGEDLARSAPVMGDTDRGKDRDFSLYDSKEIEERFRSHLTETEIEEIVATLKERAMAGDAQAMKIVMAKLFPDAPKKVETAGRVEHEHRLDPESIAIIKRLNASIGGGGVDPEG